MFKVMFGKFKKEYMYSKLLHREILYCNTAEKCQRKCNVRKICTYGKSSIMCFVQNLALDKCKHKLWLIRTKTSTAL